MKRAVVLLLVVLVAGLTATTTRADGDPASDYLLATQVFLPFDIKLPKAKQAELSSIVHAANKAGYAIRVALIGSSYDLGSVTSLWRQPRQYARFLGAELQFIYKQRLLVLMPNGFGFNWPKHPSSKEYAVLSTIPVGTSPSAMIDSTVTAVRKLAAASGVNIVPAATPVTSANGHGFFHGRTLVLIATIGGLALLVALRLALRRKTP
jgi:hypothetical protein